MKFSPGAVTAAIVLAITTSDHKYAQAFTSTTTARTTFGVVKQQHRQQQPKGFAHVATTTNNDAYRSSSSSSSQHQMASSSSSADSYAVGIVGATGAVGKEIRQCLEKRGQLPVSRLRIFGSERSAGTTIETETYGTIKVELFDVDKARECDVVFLAVSGDFALEHARALSDGDDGCVVIDNSVSNICVPLYRYRF